MALRPMGMHWRSDLAQADRAAIHGDLRLRDVRRKVIFVEPMIAKSFLDAKPALVATAAELRVQRAIDFYLTGQRLGDLRRGGGARPLPEGAYPVPPDSY